MSLSDIIQNLGSFYEFESPISYEKFTVYPIVKAVADFPVLGIFEGERQELAWIQESKDSESVQQLEAINKSEFPVLIPYLHQVEGGKQDRTIFEPIIIPIGFDEAKPLPIPARCIEQSRWRYSSSRGQTTTAKFQSIMGKLSPQMANVSTKAGDQSSVWNLVGASAEAYGVSTEEAPTSSYREIQEKSYEKDKNLGKLLEKLADGLNYKNQVGIVCVYGDHLLGVEIFGSSTLWDQFNKAVLKGFLADRVFMQKVKTGDKLQGELADIMQKELFDVKISKEKATGSGELYKFSHENWEGICIQYKGIPAHFYASKKHVDIFKSITPSQYQNIVQTTQNFLENEIPSRVAPEQIIQERRQR
ncbi:MAG: ARPP-1 family domain-containing protein [Candidatus Hermodarchaeota archaeon]